MTRNAADLSPRSLGQASRFLWGKSGRLPPSLSSLMGGYLVGLCSGGAMAGLWQAPQCQPQRRECWAISLPHLGKLSAQADYLVPERLHVSLVRL